MKFKIKYADQIVGLFSLAAVAGLVVLVFAVGANQNWFTKKNHYWTILDSGAGVAVGMPLTYKGFSIGKISSVSLEDDFVRIDYYVLEDYLDYVRENSVVELSSSPIGLGSSFTLYPGRGRGVIPSGSEIFRMDSAPAQELISAGLVRVPASGDSINALLAKVGVLLDDVTVLVESLNGALTGTDDTPIAEMVGNVNALLAMLADPEGAVPNLLGTEMSGQLAETLGSLSRMLADPNGAVPQLLGTEMSRSLNQILASVVPIASNADKLVGDAAPELAELLVQVNQLLLQLQDTATGLNNNPLLRGGIPDRSNEASAPVRARGEDF